MLEGELPHNIMHVVKEGLHVSNEGVVDVTRSAGYVGRSPVGVQLLRWLLHQKLHELLKCWKNL